MLISAIASDEIKNSLNDVGNVVFHYNEMLQQQNIKDVFYSLSRINTDVLILDLDFVNSKDFITVLQGYRIARPHTRIIVIINNRVAGDQTIATIVSLGIYDIVTNKEAVKEVVFSPPATYTQAARWHTGEFLNFGVHDKDNEKGIVGEINIAKRQIEGIVKFLGESYNCRNLNEGLLKIEQLLVKEVLYEQDY